MSDSLIHAISQRIRVFMDDLATIACIQKDAPAIVAFIEQFVLDWISLCFEQECDRGLEIQTFQGPGYCVFVLSTPKDDVSFLDINKQARIGVPTYYLETYDPTKLAEILWERAEKTGTTQ